MNMLPRATCLDLELQMEHAAFNILDEGDFLKFLDIAFNLINQSCTLLYQFDLPIIPAMSMFKPLTREPIVILRI